MTAYPSQSAEPASDRTRTYGIIGIVGAICCLPVGVIFGILSLMEARKTGKQPTLAYVAFGLCVLNILGSIFWFSYRY